MRALSNALKHNSPVYLNEIPLDSLSILRTRPVIYIVEYNYIVETMIGSQIHVDECVKFQVTEITSLHKQWGSVIQECVLIIGTDLRRFGRFSTIFSF